MLPRSKIEYFLVTLLQLSFASKGQLTSVSTAYNEHSCNTDLNCCRETSTRLVCALCVGGVCHQVLKDQYKIGLPCTLERKHCAEDYCSPRVKETWAGFGECVCYCDNLPFYGKKCDIPYALDRFNKKHNYPSGIQFITPAFVMYSFFKKGPHIVVTIDSGFEPVPALVIRDTTGGFLVRVETPDYHKDNRWTLEKCKEFVSNEDEFLYSEMCHLFVNFKRSYLVYIIPFLIPLDFYSQPGTDIKSWIVRQLKMDVVQPRLPKQPLVSTHSHDYVVGSQSSQDLEKYPIIKLINCGKTLETAHRYLVNEEIVLNANLFFYRSQSLSLERAHLGEYMSIYSRWDLYTFEGDTRHWVKKRVLEDMFPDLFIVQKFKLTPNTYVINLTVTANYWLYHKKFINFNTCVIDVAWAPLSAVLSGGSYRSVYRDDSLVLDGSESRNPNHVDDWQVKRLEMTLWCNWTKEVVCNPRTLTSYNRYQYTIMPNILKSKRAYNFTLKVSDEKVENTAYATQIIYVNEREERNNSIGEITIDCIYNCEHKSNPKDIIYLRVGGNWTNLQQLQFHWFLLNSEGKETDIGEKRQGGTSSFILIINENAFRDNETQQIEVRYKDTVQFSVYSLTMSFSSSYTCRIEPKTGEVGFTRFAITCQLTISNRVLEFYDKHENDESNFSGRMFAYQKTGDVQELILTRGRVEIHSFDEYGLDTVFSLKVELSKRNISMMYIYKLVYDLLGHSNEQEVGETFKTASVVCDLLTTTEEDVRLSKSYVYESLLELLSKLSINGYGYAKLGISTLHNALLAARTSMTLEGALYASRTICILAHALARGVKENTQCTFSTLYQILSLYLDCIFIVLETVEKHIGSKHFPINHIIPVNFRVKEITQKVLKTSYHLQSALSYKHLPGQKGNLIQSKLGNITLWTKVDIPDSIGRFSQDEYRKGTLPVIVPDALAKDATDMGFYLAVQFISFNRDPTFRFKINTRDALDVSVCFKENYGQTCKYPKRLKNGVQIAFKISDLMLKEFTNISLERLDGLLEPDWLDEELPVYKLDALPPVDMLAIFKFNSTDTTIYVAVKRDIRPTYESFMREKLELTSKSPIYQVVYNPYDTLHLYYLAIQPSNRIDVNETLSFGIKIFSKTCYSWHNHWQTRGCQSVSYLIANTVICECKSLSLIGGLIHEVVPKLDVPQNFPLFLTMKVIIAEKVMALLLVLVTFALVAFLCVRADRADRSRRFVSILPDNLPGDRYGYLVCVVTGARIGAGTNAAVGLRLYGTLNDGRRHILTNENHTVMKSMGEDWFLIFEPESLGRITVVDLWHDNSGAKSGWFCDSITIYDLHVEDCYFFYVNEWITLSLNCFPEVTILPAPLSTVLSPTNTFLDNFRLGFHLSHLWLDTFLRHPRDPVTRVDRLAIVLCFLFVSTAVSVIILKLTDSHIEVDDFSYSIRKLITIRMIVISLSACFVAAIVACILMHMFRQIYKIIFYDEKITTNKGILTYGLRSSAIDYLRQSSVKSLKDDKTYIHYGQRHKPSVEEPTKKVADIINLSLMPKPLVPVQLDGDEPNVIIRTFWLFTTWTTIALVIIICTIVSLALSKDLPPVKTLKWLSLVGIEILIHALFLQPLKITLTSAILASAFKRVIYKDVYTFNPDDGRNKSHFGDLRYMARFVGLRSKLRYKPLHEVFREKHRVTMVKANQWRRMYELMVQTLVLLLLGALLSKSIPHKYQINSHYRRLDKFYMFNMTDLKSFQYSCEAYFFKYAWYNWDLLSRDSEFNFFRKDWMFDNVNRMVGKIRLRQFRVLPGYCKAPINLTIDCAAPFSSRSKDTRSYFPFWTIQDNNTHQDTSFGLSLFSKWVYHWPSDKDFYSEGKTSQTYQSGGYMWDLKASSENMDASLARLWEEWWIDHYTRAVILEVTVYNVNTRLFSEIILLSEQTVAGQIISVTLVSSVDINIDFDWLLVIFLCFVFMMWIRIFMLANYVGAWGFLKDWRRPYEILLAVNGVAVVFYLLLHIRQVPGYVEEYQLLSDELRYFNFHRIASSKSTARSLLCSLFILNLVTFCSLWRFGKSFYRDILTLKFSTETIIFSVIIFVMFQFIFYRIVGYFLCMFVDSIFNPNMIYKFNYLHISRNRFFGVSVFSFVTSYYCVILMTVYIITFVGHYKSSRYEVMRHWGMYNYINLVKDEIKELLKTPMVTRATVRLKSIYKGRKSESRLRSLSIE